MNLKKIKGWLRRIATTEEQEKTKTSPHGAGRPSRQADQSRPGRQTPERRQDAPGERRSPPAQRAKAQSQAPKARTRPLTRQGIPILSPNEDLARHFMARADGQTEGPSKAASEQGAQVRKARGPVAPRPSVKNRKSAPRRNRAGIRQLDDQRDLRTYFMPAAPEEPDPPARPSAQAKAVPRREKGPESEIAAATDRHGIPRLDDQTDLRALFEAGLEEGEDSAADKELGEVFQASLDHDARRLMKKKTGGFFAPRRLTLKEKLRRYPAPQAQLDLHGDTALIARQRADSFLRTAGAAGTLTARIIVGKGLHSESGAVLPDVIEDLLVTLKRDGRVLTFRWDKDLKRKSGAVIVYLAPPF